MNYYATILPLFLFCNLLLKITFLNEKQDFSSSYTQSFQDTTQEIEILEGVRKLEFRKVNDSVKLTILAGQVRLKQGKSLFYCDSCVINHHTNTFDAWGNIHINDGDTAHVYSNYLHYKIQSKTAFLEGQVRLTDGRGTLTTSSLEYDLNTSIGNFRKGGKIISNKTVLTSQEGWYYADMHDVYFKKNVLLKDPAYTIQTDSLLYNTQSRVTRFIAKTQIRDSSGRIIETTEGFYDLASGKAEFGQRPLIKDGPRKYTANKIIINDSTGIVQLIGNAVVKDTAEGGTLVAGLIVQDRKKEKTLATNKPLMILKQDNDSVYISADTLFSGRLSELFDPNDTTSVKGKNKKKSEQKATDSTDRYLEAFRNVKIFSDSLQAVSDSLFYSFEDSVFRLYYDPVVWSKDNQISADTLLLFTRNKKAEKLKALRNSFLVNRLNEGIYNQVKSDNMTGWFTQGVIDSVHSVGEVSCIYFIQDEDSAYIGINESTSDILDSYFSERELFKVVFRSDVQGTIWPMREKKPAEMRLPGFRWLEPRRPKTKHDLY
ncbi:MAG: OstA family protein [Chitinophagaceae bacterium]|nr:OstA family protein [Chitinophagaceae bacterium]